MRQPRFALIDQHHHAEHEAGNTTLRYTDSDVAEHLGSFSTEAGPSAEQQPDAATGHGDAAQTPHVTRAGEQSASGHGASKPNRHVYKQNDGKYHCPLPDCNEGVRTFVLRSAWNKHMDKHERPYRCPAPKCEKIPGFTYWGGLMRHEREVHRKHGGPRVKVYCPHPNCKRHSGNGFSRQENLTEHLRRVHMNQAGPLPPRRADSPAGDSSDSSSLARKRRLSAVSLDEADEMRVEIKRLRVENKLLRAQVARLQTTAQHLPDRTADLSGPVQPSGSSSHQECPDHVEQVGHQLDPNDAHATVCSHQGQPDGDAVLHGPKCPGHTPRDSARHDDLQPIENPDNPPDMAGDALLEQPLDPDAAPSSTQMS
ncbi:hypothetical protein CDD82_4202 [Ophiocordyceps australis]|uniref:C2H2-type domain-containing protein n=1 Tax=Ophiocordyceps australis TaxID=1399860 RepID=A0A2C5Z2A7_9HYPO|nr:hypothetical protein CDD82_4202 [Ophiocordyceps australis]